MRFLYCSVGEDFDDVVDEEENLDDIDPPDVSKLSTSGGFKRGLIGLEPTAANFKKFFYQCLPTSKKKKLRGNK